MARRLVLLLLLSALCAGAARAQGFAFPWDPRTGDPWMDVALADLNTYAARHPGAFVDELVRYYDAPREYVEGLLAAHWAPGDVYYACALGRLAGRSCRYVAEAWQAHHGEGWAAVAGRVGTPPGGAADERLVQAVASSYAHWARPLPPRK